MIRRTLLLAAVFASIPTFSAYAFRVLEDFNYANFTDLSGQNGYNAAYDSWAGQSWGTSGSIMTFNVYGQEGQYQSEDLAAYAGRNFPNALRADINISYRMRTDYGPTTDSEAGELYFGSALGIGPKIGFYYSGGTLYIRARTYDGAGYVNLSSASQGINYNISIDNVDFGARTYRAGINGGSYQTVKFAENVGLGDLSWVRMHQNMWPGGRVLVTDNIDIQGEVPEPSSLALFGMGILWLIGGCRTRAARNT